MKNKQQYFRNGLLLTAVAILMRTVSVSFNIYVSGKVGAEAMGLLSLISGIYGFALTLATSGINLATIRTIAKSLEQTKGAGTRAVLRSCISYASFFGVISSILLLTLAYPLGTRILRDIRTVRALRMLAFTLPPISITSVLNGYFVAVRRAYKNALAQVVEQAAKITFTGYLLTVAAPNTVEGCVLAILMGGAVSEVLSLFLNLFLYFIDKRKFRHIRQKSFGKVGVAAIAMPVAISAYARSGLISIEHILIKNGLTRYSGGNAAALSAYGAMHGMALPVVLYPAAILTSFASLLIPEITEQQSAGNHREITYIAGRVYQMTLLFAVGAAGVLLFLSGEVGRVLYNSEEVGLYIRRLAPLIPIMYLDTATDAMLKGLGEQVYSMNVNILDALISVLCVFIFVPILGINGYVITIYITEVFNAALSIIRLLKISGFSPAPAALLFRPIISIIGATCTSRLIFCIPCLQFRESGFALFLHILTVALLYLLFLSLTGAFNRADRKWIISALFPKFTS